MDERISRLMDGELDDAGADAAIRDLRHPDGVATWVCYHVIGDALRRSGTPMPGFAERFGTRLAAEPTVLAPRQRQVQRLPMMWAAAATIAAVLVVGSVAVSTLQPPPTAVAIDSASIAAAVDAAVEEASAAGITGAELTPFLLRCVGAATGGRSLEVNLGLLESNAALAAEIATALVRAA